MSQVVINDCLRTGLYNYHDNYFTCRNASTSMELGAGEFGVGQKYISGDYYGDYWVMRGFLYFDTSGIPTNAVITSAILERIGNITDVSDTDFYIVLKGAESAHNPVVKGDYDLTLYGGESLGKLIISSTSLMIELNSSGLNYINRGGITKFILLSLEDINNDPPTGKEYIAVSGTYNRLTVNYTGTFEPTETPTISTVNAACEDRQSTTLTAVGNIITTGGGCTYRGFEYYQYGYEYDSSMYAVREIGEFPSTGEYRMTLSGLKPSTIYWIRAFAGNVFGIDYGEWILCSTLGVQVGSYEIHEETNTATICFYVSEDNGHTWSLKFGPYTTDQADIAITKILVRGSGKKQIKFTTNLLTGLSVSVMCKVDVKI